MALENTDPTMQAFFADFVAVRKMVCMWELKDIPPYKEFDHFLSSGIKLNDPRFQSEDFMARRALKEIGKDHLYICKIFIAAHGLNNPVLPPNAKASDIEERRKLLTEIANSARRNLIERPISSLAMKFLKENSINNLPGTTPGG